MQIAGLSWTSSLHQHKGTRNLAFWGLLTVLGAFALSLLTLPAFGQKKLAPLPIEEVAKTRDLAWHSVDLSVDGEWVAYTTEDPSDFVPIRDTHRFYTPTGVPTGAGDGRMEAWVSNTRTGETLNLSGSVGSSWGPVWAPDGQHLAFYSDRSGQARLWIWEKKNRHLRQVSDAIVRPLYWFELVRWTPDGRKVLCKVLPEGMTLDEAAKLIPAVDDPRATQTNEKGPAVLVFTSPSKPTAEEAQPRQDLELSGGLFASLADLALIDVETGAVKRIVRGAKARWFSFSPDGTHVGLTTIKGWEANSQQLVYDLQVYSLAEDRTWFAAQRVKQMYGINVSWSPNGDVLSYLTHGSRAAGECFVVPITGGEPRRCASGSHPSLADYFRAPLWDEKGKVLYFIGDGALWKIVLSTGMATEVAKIPNRKITEIVAPQGGGRFWSPDGGGSLVVTTRDEETKQAGFYRIDLKTGQTFKLLEENKEHGWLFSFDVSDDSGQVVYRAEDAQHPGDLWITNPNFRSPRRVTNVAPLFDEYEMGTSRLIEWLSVDGQRLRGALLLPAGYKEKTRYPLIVHVYGGSTGSNSVNEFGFFGYLPSVNMQVLATRGYAILYPDAPQRVGTPLKDVANTVLPGVNRVIELGIADPDRLAVMGHSYGSYSTLALIVQTNRFKAAIINAVVPSNLLVGYLRMSSDSSAGPGYYEEGQGAMGGTPWQYRDRYIENSPVYYFDKVETPLLMAHGTMDGNPVEFPDHTFAALRRLGKKVQYVLYGGEGHVIVGYANTIDFWNRRIAWLEEHLGKPAAPTR